MLSKEDKFKILSTYLNEDICHSIRKFTEALSRQNQTLLLRTLVVSIELINTPLNNSDADNFLISYSHLRAVLSSRVSSYSAASQQISRFNKLILFMINEGHFKLESKESKESMIALFSSPFTRALYESCKAEQIPDDVYKKINHYPEELIILKENPFSIEVNARVKYLSDFLNDDIYKLLVNYLGQSSSQRQTQLTYRLVESIQLLSEPLNRNDTDELVINLTNVLSYLCKKCAKSTTNATYTHLRNFITYLMKFDYFSNGSINRLNDLLKPLNDFKYNNLKNSIISEEIKSKFTPDLTGEEIFNNTLQKCCTPEIAQRLKEHVNTFTVKKHHRSPLVTFLNRIYKVSPDWYDKPNVIQAEILKFRSDLLNDKQRNSVYGNLQNVKNALTVLSKHGLLPPILDLPNNLRRCTKTEKIRKNNPLISAINIYDDTKKESYINTSEFLEFLKEDLSSNLEILVTVAQDIVYEGYKKFKSKADVIEKSQYNEFINHPCLRVTRLVKSSKNKQESNPFYLEHPLRNENLTAYYNHYFDALVRNETPHKIYDLAFSDKLIGYLGLTTNVASAMQIIITTELGINPYSLYRVKIVSDAQGHEFVQVDDEGSVRLKALKPRARNARTRIAKGSIESLENIKASYIDSSTCLKMALEMTLRTRESLGVKDLWVCLGVKGATIAQIDSFQREFRKISKKASSKSSGITGATLSKVRASKGVLIYLESNGDSLKTANYLGNTVKTTLNRYIPKYLTELVYRVKIRNFQKILLFMSVAFDEDPAVSLNMSKDDFKVQVTKAFENPDMGGNLFNKLTKPDNNKEIYFCLSDANLRLAMAYAKNGEDKKLREDCKNVINKVSEGPVIMKKMLRKAQIAVDNSL